MLTLLDALDTPVAILTADARLEWVNAAGASWLGGSATDHVGELFVDIAPQAAALASAIARACAGAQAELEHDGRSIRVLPFGGGCAVLVGHGAASRTEPEDDEAITTVVHDLRTPLLNLSLAANVLRQSGHETSADVGELVFEAGQRLQRLTRDLTDFTRERLGLARPLNAHTVDVHALARTAIETVRLSVPSAAIELETHGSATARVESDRIAQVLQNLLVHGLKNRKPRSATRLSIRTTPEQLAIELSVVGTSPRDAHSFELEIVRAGARAHAGTVRIVARDEAGTTFVVHVPLTQSAEPDPEADSQ